MIWQLELCFFDGADGDGCGSCEAFGYLLERTMQLLCAQNPAPETGANAAETPTPRQIPLFSQKTPTPSENPVFSQKLPTPSENPLFLQNTPEMACEYSVFARENKLFLQLQDLSAERFAAIAERLGELLPQSLFCTGVHASSQRFARLAPRQNFFRPAQLAPCPLCAAAFAAQRPCALCGQPPADAERIAKAAEQIAAGVRLRVRSSSGVRIFSTTAPEPAAEAPAAEPAKLYATELSRVHEFARLSAKELRALASYEKPALRLCASERLCEQLGAAQICLQAAADTTLLALFVLLSARGVGVVFEAAEFDSAADFAPCDARPARAALQALVLENDAQNGGLVVLKSAAQPPQNASEHLAAILRANAAEIARLAAKKGSAEILHFHLGRDDFSVQLLRGNLLSCALNLPLPRDLFALQQAVACDGESGARLIENFAAARPGAFAQNISFAHCGTGICGLWAIARELLQMSDEVLPLARASLRMRGPAIDYALAEPAEAAEPAAPTLLAHRVLRSCMSFSLAGASEGLIALGLVEGFARAIARVHASCANAGAIALSGDLLGDKMLGDFIYQNFRAAPVFRAHAVPQELQNARKNL